MIGCFAAGGYMKHKAKMKFLDANDPFFAAAWRRWAAALLPLAWGAVELYNGSPGWAVVFAAAGAYAFFILIIKGRDEPDPDQNDHGPDDTAPKS